MNELGFRKSTLITLEEENIMKEGNKIIEVVPVWKYILEPDWVEIRNPTIGEYQHYMNMQYRRARISEGTYFFTKVSLEGIDATSQ